MSFLPPGAPAGNTLTLDSFAFSSDPVILKSSLVGVFSFKFPADIRVNLRQDKIYTSTRIAGRDGTVKEVSGFDDWQITIEFKLVSPAYNISLPLIDSMITKLKDLKKLWRKESVLMVVNERLNALGINYLFLKTLDLPDGDSYWIQPVSIQALSDDGN